MLAGDTPVLVHNSTCTRLPSTGSDEFAVIGNRTDTKFAMEWPNHEVLSLKSYSLEKNDAWIRGIIEKRQKVYLASPINDQTLSSAKGDSIFSRELNQLLGAGYNFSRDGQYMLPPPVAK